MQNYGWGENQHTMSHHREGRRASHVIVIAGASGSGKTQLIEKLCHPPHDDFILQVLKHLDCNPNQRLKRSTVERMQRLMDPVNFKKRKTRKLKQCLLLHIDLTSIKHLSFSIPRKTLLNLNTTTTLARHSDFIQ